MFIHKITMRLSTLSILSIIVIIVSVVLDYYEFANDRLYWFQRSGAVMVILGIIFESRYVFVDDKTSQKAEENLQVEHISKFNYAFLKKHAGFFFILFGTFIWGFGDIIHKFFMS